jgi:hypothetical protein
MEVNEIWLQIGREKGEREGTKKGEKWKGFCSFFFLFVAFVFFYGEKRCEKKRE